MREAPRTASAKSSGGGSRRRRWEMKSKESFEKSLAVEIDSPRRKTPHYRRDSKRESSTEPPDDKNPFFQDEPRSSPPKDFTHQNEAGQQDSESDLLSSKLSALIEEASVKSKEPEKRSLGENRRSSWSHLEQKPERNTQEPQYIEQGGIKSLKDRDKAQVLNDKFETKSLKLAGETPKKKLEQLEEEKVEEADYIVPTAPPMSSPESSKTLPTRKKKDRRKSSSRILMEGSTNKKSYITLQLQEMEEDVISTGRDEQCVLSAPALLFNTTINPTGTINTIYQEKLDGFVVARNGTDGVQRKNEHLRDSSEVPTPSSHAIFLQSGFRTFSVLCQGLLAGITLAHCLMVGKVQSGVELIILVPLFISSWNVVLVEGSLPCKRG